MSKAKIDNEIRDIVNKFVSSITKGLRTRSAKTAASSVVEPVYKQKRDGFTELLYGGVSYGLYSRKRDAVRGARRRGFIS